MQIPSSFQGSIGMTAQGTTQQSSENLPNSDDNSVAPYIPFLPWSFDWDLANVQ
jgi:hypothetical protein